MSVVDNSKPDKGAGSTNEGDYCDYVGQRSSVVTLFSEC